MALVIRGKTRCQLCGNVIGAGDEIVMFPPIIANELDPLLLFHDAGFHADCFYRHPLADRMLARLDEYERKTRRPVPGFPVCTLCGRDIASPDEHVSLYVTEDEGDPLHEYNYLQAHRSCLARWPELGRVYEYLLERRRSGTWTGRGIDWQIHEIETILREAN